MGILRGLVLVLATLCVSVSSARADDALVLSTGMAEPWTNAEGTGFTDRFIAELFRRLGVPARVVFNPASARALQLADSGTDDGLAARIAGMESQYPNLIPVPEPIFVNDFVAVGLRGGGAVRTWNDLRPRSVGYILGWQVFEHNMPDVRALTAAKDGRQLFTLLRAGRIEIALHERWQATWLARDMGLEIEIHEPPLAATPMYVYLNRRHAALVPRVAAELRAMKAEGRARAIMADALAGRSPRP